MAMISSMENKTTYIAELIRFNYFTIGVTPAEGLCNFLYDLEKGNLTPEELGVDLQTLLGAVTSLVTSIVEDGSVSQVVGS